MNIPGYDAWKLASPPEEDVACDWCGEATPKDEIAGLLVCGDCAKEVCPCVRCDSPTSNTDTGVCSECAEREAREREDSDGFLKFSPQLIRWRVA